MKKQVLFTILAMLVSVSAFSHDIEVANADGVAIYYNYINDGTELEVTYQGSYFGSYSGNVVIPEEVTYMKRTHKVTSIGGYAFYGCTGLTSVTIPNSVTSIGIYAFRDCSSFKVIVKDIAAWCGIKFGDDYSNPFYAGHLYSDEDTEITNLIIPNSVTSIGYKAFQGCTGLTSVTIPNSVTSIGSGAFRDCSGLTSVTIPNSVTSIGWDAFSGCSGLTSVTIPNSVTSIGDQAFYSCSGLTSITIPNSVTSIGNYVFANCSGLTSVTIPNSVTAISEFTFFGCSALTSITVPEGVTSIGTRSFYNCSSLESITIPASMCLIHQEAFANCSNLKEVNALPEEPPVAYTNSFSNYDITLKVLEKAADDYKSTVPWSNFGIIVPLQQYQLVYYVDNIEYKAFSIAEGAKITEEQTPTKEGYTFSGWSEIPTTMPAHDVTVTGTFTINTYKIIYMVDGVEYGTSEVTYGAEVNPIGEPEKEGYTFLGWSDLPETMPAHDVMAVANYEPNSYTLIYMVDGVEYKKTTEKYGYTVNPEETPTKEGYTFSGWEGLPETMPAHDVTVTGTFSINTYKIIYMVDGVEYGTSEVTYGAEVNPIGEPSKEGYTFSGWMNLPEEMPAHDVTVTGTFSFNSYKVTFVYGDSILTTIEVKYGAAIELPTSLNSERYTLIEWKDVPDTMPAHDITIYADYVDGISTITVDSKDEQYIRMNGMYTPDLKPGLNIIRMKDGTTKKVWVK